MKIEFSRQIFEKYSNISFIKIRPMRVELFRVDRRTGMTKPTVAFRNFTHAPEQ